MLVGNAEAKHIQKQFELHGSLQRKHHQHQKHHQHWWRMRRFGEGKSGDFSAEKEATIAERSDILK